MPGHFHHHHGGRGRGGGPDDMPESSHPIFRRDKRGSRYVFKEFLEKKGIFGRRKTPEEEEEAKRKEDEKRSRGGGKGPGQGAERDKTEASEKGEQGKRSVLSRFWRVLWKQRAGVFGLLLLIPVGLGARAIMPWMSKYIFDTVLGEKTGMVVTERQDLLHEACMILAVVAVLNIVVTCISDYLGRSVIGNLVTALKRRMMRHLQQMPLERLQELKVGGVVTRIQSDTETMAGLLHQTLITPLTAMLMLVIAVGSLFVLSPKVATISLGFLVGLIALSYFFFHIMRPLQRQLREQVSQIGGHLTETFSGVSVVRAFRKEHAETAAYGFETHLLWRKSLHATILNIVAHRLVWVIYWGMMICTWLYGGLQVIAGDLKIGALVAFAMFIEWLFGPIFMIMGSLAQLQRSFACAERIFDLLDEPLGMADREDASAIERINEAVVFADVSFAYPDGTEALKHVSFDIPVGKVTALVGPSGAGKSTVTNLVMRFYDVTDGQVLVDGTDVRDLRLGSYRQLMGLVLQDVFLFDGTIKENIAYGLPAASDDAIQDAAKVAHAHEFVTEFEKGYDSLIGERGVKLSGGQKQRVALARAILANPQLLILDEATSSLDSESEALIQDALRHIFKGRTTLVIAHRLSTIMDADNIVVLDRGEKKEEGTHEELLAKRGRYWDLYTKQMEKVERGKQYLAWDAEDEEEKAEAS